MCCSQQLFQDGVCSDIGHIIISKNLKHSSTYIPMTAKFLKDENTASVKQTINNINASGIYYLYFINCEGNPLGKVSLEGSLVTWKNPFGELSGEQYFFLPFYGVLSLLYTFTGIAWFILCAIYWRQILPIQHCIAGVIGLGMIECATWYFEYKNYNMYGIYHLGAIIIGILVSTFKRTVSRLLVLVVAMGFGVVKANLGTTKYKVLFLGELYFIFSGAFQILSGNSSAEGLTTMLVIPVALLDTFFYWWIFLSLARTISQLTIRRQPLKLSMYKTLFATLIISGLVSGAIIIYQLYTVLEAEVDERWETWWMWEAFWHLLYFFVLLAIAILWRPTSNNTRYAYAELKEDEDGMDMVQILSGVGELSQRNKISEKEEPHKPSDSKTEPKGKDIVPQFNIEDDEESQVESSKLN